MIGDYLFVDNFYIGECVIMSVFMSFFCVGNGIITLRARLHVLALA